MTLWNDTLTEHRNKLNDHLIDTAIAAVREVGPAGVTMSGLAKRAGVSRQTLYNHFADVDAILVAYVQLEAAIDQAALRAVMRDADGPYAKLELFLRWFSVIAVTRPPVGDIQAMVGPGRTEQVDIAENVLASIIRDGVAAEAFRSDPDFRQLASALLHTLGALRPLAASGATTDTLLARAADYARRLLS
jgi:AcrR family transcriptional regulator